MVSKVLRRENRVIVEGVNHKKKHLKPQAEQPGRVVEVEAPMHISNVALVDPTDGYVGGWHLMLAACSTFMCNCGLCMGAFYV